MSHNIYILSAPVRSGKTTALMEFWESEIISCDGFITPEIDESRKMIFLDTDEEIPFELENKNDEDAIEVGNFLLSKSAFHRAKNKIRNLHQSKAGLIILDEIGKLELAGQGFEPELSEFIENFKLHSTSTILIVVIRNTLLNEAIKKYNLENASVLSLQLFIDNFVSE